MRYENCERTGCRRGVCKRIAREKLWYNASTMAARILIVDDSKVLTDMVADMLKDFGYAVAGRVNTIKDALEAVEKERPDLVLLDLSLPDGDGFMVIDHIRDKKIPSKVIVVTANLQKQIKEQAAAKGVHAILNKPFNAKDLIAAVQSALPA